MFADTITITINAVAKVLTRINQDKYSSEYILRDVNDSFRLQIRNTILTDKSRGVTIERHNVELVQTVFATATTPVVVRKAYSVFENEATDGVTAPLNFDLGFTGFFTSANLTKLINLES